MRRRIVTADEQDVHTKWRHILVCYQRAGAARKVKTATNRRERREARAEVREQTKQHAPYRSTRRGVSK